MEEYYREEEQSDFEGESEYKRSTVLNHKKSVKKTKVRLNNRTKMPILGFGTYKLQGLTDVYDIVDYALDSGYRLFDTSADYLNERDIGTSLMAKLPKHDLEREEIFIISKLGTKDQCAERVRRTVMKSLKNLLVDYIDLYLVHWPGGNVAQYPDDSSPLNREVRHETWEHLIRMLDEEKVKAIGVSNFCARHITDLLEFSSVKPVINQVEFHPHYRQRQELIDLCAEFNIILQAYGLLGGGDESIIHDPVIINVMQEIRSTIDYVNTGNLILRWALQNNYCVLTRASDYAPLHCNALLDFCISDKHMEIMNSITTRKKIYWDPECIKH